MPPRLGRHLWHGLITLILQYHLPSTIGIPHIYRVQRVPGCIRLETALFLHVDVRNVELVIVHVTRFVIEVRTVLRSRDVVRGVVVPTLYVLESAPHIRRRSLVL